MVFVGFFGLFSGTYFYKHCLKKTTSLTNYKSDYQISSQRERYNSLNQDINVDEEHTMDPDYLVPVSNAHYEDVINHVNRDDNV